MESMIIENVILIQMDLSMVNRLIIGRNSGKVTVHNLQVTVQEIMSILDVTMYREPQRILKQNYILLQQEKLKYGKELQQRR
jgi:hypothetical protein